MAETPTTPVIEGYVTCFACDGEGQTDDFEWPRRCPACDGSGLEECHSRSCTCAICVEAGYD